MIAVQIIILIYSVILHEIAHGFVADRLGDPTAKANGRLTLNPIPHIDPILTLALPLFLILSGSPFVFGGAKPVPVDPYNFSDTKKGIMLTSLAGPLTNLALALLASLLLRFTRSSYDGSNLFFNVQSVLIYTSIINLFLGVFNLLPIPPLDGFKVVGGILPDTLSRIWMSLERFGFLFIILTLLLFGSILSSFVYPVTNYFINLLLRS